MISDIQLDSLVMAIKEGRVKIGQVPKELRKAVNKQLETKTETK